jgi:hypothetical protein
MLACGYAVQHCASGEIGRRAGFRFQCLRTCGFKSRLAHQMKKRFPFCGDRFVVKRHPGVVVRLLTSMGIASAVNPDRVTKL